MLGLLPCAFTAFFLATAKVFGTLPPVDLRAVCLVLAISQPTDTRHRWLCPAAVLFTSYSRYCALGQCFDVLALR